MRLYLSLTSQPWISLTSLSRWQASTSDAEAASGAARPSPAARASAVAPPVRMRCVVFISGVLRVSGAVELDVVAGAREPAFETPVVVTAAALVGERAGVGDPESVVDVVELDVGVQTGALEVLFVVV